MGNLRLKPADSSSHRAPCPRGNPALSCRTPKHHAWQHLYHTHRNTKSKPLHTPNTLNHPPDPLRVPSSQVVGTPINTCSVPQSLTHADPESQPAQNHKHTLLAITPHTEIIAPPQALWGTPWDHPAVPLCLQVPPGDNEGLTYTELQAVTPSICRPGASTVPQPPVIYTEVGFGGPR